MLLKIIIISAIVMIGICVSFAGGLWGQSNEHAISKVLHLSPTSSNKVTGIPTDCRCVAFRLDDVQASWDVAAQEQILSRFNASNTPLTIGLIGHYILDRNQTHIEFIKSIHSKLELANHGWNHEDFTMMGNDADQAQLLMESNNAIKIAFGKTPITFITPHNRMNTDTVIAAQAAGIKYISSFVGDSPLPYVTPQNVTGIVEVPGTIAAGDVNLKTQQWSNFTGIQVMREIDKSISKYGFAVVVLHPQVFISTNNKINTEQLAQLSMLLNLVKNAYPTVTLSEIKNK